jgi:hypothetical protein
MSSNSSSSNSSSYDNCSFNLLDDEEKDLDLGVILAEKLVEQNVDIDEFMDSVISFILSRPKDLDPSVDEPLDFIALRNAGYSRDLSHGVLEEMCDPDDLEMYPLLKGWCQGVGKTAYLTKYQHISAKKMSDVQKRDQKSRVSKMANLMLHILYEVSQSDFVLHFYD